MSAPDWFVTKDGDRTCLALYERHYSRYRYADGRRQSQFFGPGEHIVLRTGDGDALFVWRKFIDDSGQIGVNCAVFRNESKRRIDYFGTERAMTVRPPGLLEGSDRPLELFADAMALLPAAVKRPAADPSLLAREAFI